MVLQISCYHCGAILSETKAICSKRMHKLASVKVNYRYTLYQVKDTPHTGLPKNVECFSLWQNITCKTHAFKHCQCDKLCSQVQMQAFFYFFVLSDTTLLFWPGIAAIFQVTSDLPFRITKYATVTLYPLKSSLARFKKCHQLFYNYRVFAGVQIKNGNILLFL